MITTAIIAEYNPFHNGHAYQIRKAKELTGADCIIVILGGNFMQRGEPAFMDKYIRTEMALTSGADLVLELPVCYAASSAEYFAKGAVSLLNALGIVDYLCFGSECGDLALLKDAASVLAGEPEQYKALLKEGVKKGYSFPRARTDALSAFLSDCSFLESPNNILALEYLKALLLSDSAIKPVTVKRLGADYHNSSFYTEADAAYPSAKSVRECLLTAGDDLVSGSLSHYVPKAVLSLLSAHRNQSYPVVADDFSQALIFKLLEDRHKKKTSPYASYLDITNDFSDKIAKNLYRYTTVGAFCGLLKSKELTHTRVSRNLFHILLSLTSSDLEEYTAHGTVFYAHLLGINKSKPELTKSLKANSSLPLLVKPSNSASLLSKTGQKQFASDLFASHLYEGVVSQKFHRPMKNEFQREIVTVMP